MAYAEEELPSNTTLMINQPYDECVEVPDGEEVASLYTPTPRNGTKKPGLFFQKLSTLYLFVPEVN